MSFKVVIVGDSNVGKTSILQRYAKDVFRTDIEPTIGPQFMSKLVELEEGGPSIKLQIWDTAGQEKYRSVTPIYYRDAAAAVCVFDVTSRQSLDAAERWVQDLKQYAPGHIILALAGNKADLHGQAEVSLEEGRAFQAKHAVAIFGETSAKENTGIEELFQKVARKINENRGAIEAANKLRQSNASLNTTLPQGRGGRCKC